MNHGEAILLIDCSFWGLRYLVRQMRKREPAFLNGREDETFGRQKSFVRVQNIFALPEFCRKTKGILQMQ
jgi:hypothetical protein